MTALNSYSVHSLTIQPAQSTTLDISGSYVACLELSILLGHADKPAVNISVDQGSAQSIEPGLTFFTNDREEFRSITLQNPNATKTIDVKIAVGFGTLVDARTIPELLPNPYSHVNNFRAFFGNVGLPALAGNFSHLQLLNPSGTAVRHYVHRLTLFSTFAVTVQLYYYGSVALPTLVNNGKSKQTSPSFASLLDIRSEQRVATVVSGLIHTIDVPANQLIEFPGLDKDPFLIGSGRSVIFVPSVQNVGLNLTAHYQELPA